jgi:hypothetical protein
MQCGADVAGSNGSLPGALVKNDNEGLQMFVV